MKLDLWIKFFNEGENLDAAALPSELASDPDITRAFTELERMGFDPQERALYESEVKAKMADIAELQYATEEGLRQGLELGRNQGMVLGRQSQERMLLRIMLRRFGPAPDGWLEHLGRLTMSELEELGEALVDLDSYVAVEEWIAKH